MVILQFPSGERIEKKVSNDKDFIPGLLGDAPYDPAIDYLFMGEEIFEGYHIVRDESRDNPKDVFRFGSREEFESRKDKTPEEILREREVDDPEELREFFGFVSHLTSDGFECRNCGRNYVYPYGMGFVIGTYMAIDSFAVPIKNESD